MQFDLSDFYDFMDISNSRDVSHDQIVEWLKGLDLNSTDDELMLVATTHELTTLWKQREIGMAASLFWHLLLLKATNSAMIS